MVSETASNDVNGAHECNRRNPSPKRNKRVREITREREGGEGRRGEGEK